MNEQLTKLLTDLAEKLGTTAEHLWSVLIRQAYISGTAGIVITVILIASLIGWLKFILKKMRPDSRGCREWDYGNNSKEWSWMAWGASVTLSLMVIACQYGDILGLFNPEFWALQQILKSVSK